jgi:hypothetical protein
MADVRAKLARLTHPARVLGVPSHRAERIRKTDRDLLQQRYQEQGRNSKPSGEALNSLWHELKNPASAIRELDLARLPADALAFYRPFHFSPHEEWGIYILVEPLLQHCDILYRAFGGKLAAFNLEALMGCVLFEVFHHEFFHHLTECAATRANAPTGRLRRQGLRPQPARSPRPRRHTAGGCAASRVATANHGRRHPGSGDSVPVAARCGKETLLHSLDTQFPWLPPPPRFPRHCSRA